MPIPLILPLSRQVLAADEAWWRIYDEAFAPPEREPRTVHLEAVRRGVGVAVAARDGEKTVGLASLHLLQDPAAVFLVYLAMAPDRRGRGEGGRLLDEALALGREQLRSAGREPRGWVCEVTRPTSVSGAPGVNESLLRFYGRHGGRLLAAPYVQPPVDGKSYVPMSLLYAPDPGTPLPDEEQTARLIHAIHHEKYGAINGIPRHALDKCLHLAASLGAGPE